MTEYMHLIGAEDVRAAGRAMNEAASEMQRAMSYMDSALQQHQRFMDDWLMRFQQTMEKATP
jgi:Sec-independent protein translocase protein TatA